MKDPSSLSVFLDRLAEYIGYSLVLFIFVAGLSSIGQVFTSFGKHGVGQGQLLFRIGSLLICFTSLATIVLRNRRGRLAVVTRRWALLRLFVYLALGALIAISLAFTRNRQADHFHVSAFALSAFLTGGGIWILAACFWERVAKLWEKAAFRTCEAVLAEIVVICVLAEVILSLMASHTYSPLFVREGRMDSILRHLRLPPGTVQYDIRINSRGYFDEEFFAAGDNDLVIVCLADSFGLGRVPHRYNFTTVAERKLTQSLAGKYSRVAVHNFGVPVTALPEYTYIYEKEACLYRPRFVIVCVFVGNDISDLRTREGSRNTAILIQERWLWVVLSRVFKVSRGKAEGLVEPHRDDLSTTELNDAGIPDFVFDAAKEKPSFSEEAFLQVEKHRAEVCIPGRYEREYRLVCKDLRYLKEEIGQDLLVVLIPDEFQVNDTLWGTLADKDPHYDRDLPQKVIGDFCRGNGICLLDLLPALREAEKGGRCYHLRDTHWNARGNQVAGERIAEEIHALLNRVNPG